MRIIPWIVVLLLAQTLSAQQPATEAFTRYAIGGMVGAEILGDMVLVEATSKLSLDARGIIKINAGATNVSVSAYRFVNGNWDLIEAREVLPLVFAIEKPGNWLVDIDGDGVTGKKRFALVVGPSQPSLPVDPPAGDFGPLIAKSKQLATALADQPTAALLSSALDALLARGPPPVDIVSARKLVSSTIETALLARTGASRDKDWLHGWRTPVAMELAILAGAGKFPTSTEYFRAIKALSESLK